LVLLLQQQDASEEVSDLLPHGGRDQQGVAKDARERALGKGNDDVADHVTDDVAAKYLHFARIKKAIEDIEREASHPSGQVPMMPPEARCFSLQEGESGVEEEEGSGDDVRYHIRGEEGDLVIINKGKDAAQGELENTRDIEIDVMGRRSVGLHLLEESASDI
jgi:hypothetical protein